jgi:hypothetical protein
MYCSGTALPPRRSRSDPVVAMGEPRESDVEQFMASLPSASLYSKSYLRQFSEALNDLFIRIYRLDPNDYATNEWHVKHELEKLAAATVDSADRMRQMSAALRNLQRAVEDLEIQPRPFVIEEELDVEELLWIS